MLLFTTLFLYLLLRYVYNIVIMQKKFSDVNAALMSDCKLLFAKMKIVVENTKKHFSKSDVKADENKTDAQPKSEEE